MQVDQPFVVLCLDSMSPVMRKPVICICKTKGLRENLSSGFPTSSDTNRAVQPLKMARGLKFQIYEVELLYYLCSENKGAEQLCGNHDLQAHIIQFNLIITRLSITQF